MNDEIKEKILKYFKRYDDNRLLALDLEYEYFYTGVTVPYIVKYVLLNKYEYNDVIDALLELHNSNEIRALYCSNVENIVFHVIRVYRNYNKNKLPIYGNSESKHNYTYFINELNKLKQQQL